MKSNSTQAQTLGRKKVKVKSGCITCKARKLKCDEGWPACRRCVSVGRTCDGYGIWGGGSNVLRESPSSHQDILAFHRRNQSFGDNVLAPRMTLHKDSFCLVSLEDHTELEWFFYRTRVKLSGLFPPEFWSTLLVQAMHENAAVMHSVLALNAVHRADICAASHDTLEVQRHKRFAIQQYVKALRNLQPHFKAKDWRSSRVVLITCLIFVFMEYLRADLTTGHMHLSYGLKLLGEHFGHKSSSDGQRTEVSIDGLDYTDRCIMEMFFRLHVECKMHPIGHGNVVSPRMSFARTLRKDPFKSIHEARNELDQNMMEILNMKADLQEDDSDFQYNLLKHQSNIRNGLNSWFERYSAVRTDSDHPFTIFELISYQSLLSHFAMAEIACACIVSEDESLYDVYTDKFIHIIELSRALHEMVYTSTVLEEMLPADHAKDAPKNSSDRGWIPPLFFTAVKCRVHQVRLQALQLLSSSKHVEGVWDSQLAVGIAQSVIQFEESGGQAYKATETQFDPGPSLTVPPSHRVHNVQIHWIDEISRTVSLAFSRHKWEMATQVTLAFDDTSQSWKINPLNV